MDGNANICSRLISTVKHDNIVHMGVREIQAVCMKAVTKKE